MNFDNKRKEEKVPTGQEMLTAIREFVLGERKRLRIKRNDLGVGFLFEGSCFARGEFYNLLYGQLLYTHFGFGGWRELNNIEVLLGTYEEVQKIKRERALKTRRVQVN